MDTKKCGICSREFSRLQSYSGPQWEARKYCSRECMGAAQREASLASADVKVCPICGAEFHCYPSQSHLRVTCGSRPCKREYRQTVTAAKISATARANYANGKRTPGKGVSAREVDLWPALREAGWSWRLKWTDAHGAFELDFSLPDRKLNVEIDGEEHFWPKGRAKDERRDAELQRRGWRILRIPNQNVDDDPQVVLATILAWADGQGR